MILRVFILHTLVLACLTVALPSLAAPPATPAPHGFSAADHAYWAFQPVATPSVPNLPENLQTGNPVDHFVRHRQQQHRLTHAPPAGRLTLVRRVTFDLTGLPPTPTEISAFIDDPSPDAYEKLVDRLLASPHYGEHAARIWLDLVRYADSDGFKADKFRPHAYRYRDYVIRSFNIDKPYDQFVREQLAGDELFPDDLDAHIATGFLRHTPDEDNQKDVRRQWTINLNDATEATAEVFLAMGMRCARCHDHKFDPVLQRDYYRLQAFFAPMLPVNEILDPGDPAARDLYLQSTADIRQRLDTLTEPHFLEGRINESKKFPDYIKPTLKKPAAQLSPLEAQYTYLAVRQLSGSDKKTRERLAADHGWQTLAAQLASHDAIRPDTIPLQSVTDVSTQAPPTHVGDSNEPTPPGFFTILDPGPADINPVPTSPHTTGRRAALANWIASPHNPLTSRVIVNRLWQQHFGTGIVATTNDFGRQGATPSHPQLLDWLANRLIGEQWHLKPLHRLIVTSSTYRQSSAHPDHHQLAKLDPRARLLCAAPVRRLSGDQLRDAMLVTSGELDSKALGPGQKGNTPCRSIFVNNIRNNPDEMLHAFDGANMFESCARRYVSTTPVQSLLVLNGDWTIRRANAMASRIADLPGQPAQIDRAFHLALGRPPTARDHTTAQNFLKSHHATATDPARALADLCHVLLASNEFAYVD